MTRKTDDSVTMSKLAEFDSMWRDSDGEKEGEGVLLNDYLNSNDKIKKPKREKIKDKPKSNMAPSSKMEKKQRDDDRRRQSIAERSKLKAQQQNMIKTALSSTATSKRILFDSDDDEKPPIKKDLFADEDEEANDVVNDSISIDKDSKLVQLQARFNHDERFRVDERFIDNKDDYKDDIHREHSEGVLPMVRFTPSATETKMDKKGAEKPKRKQKHNEYAAVTSKDKYYEVADSIKESLQTSNGGFSLLAAYGGSYDASVSTTQENIAPKAFSKKNPLLDVSSDDDDEEGCDQEKESVIAPWRPTVNFPLSGSSDRFFFIENDPLFADALEFINKKNSEEAEAAAEQYSETRRVLKKSFKAQFAKRSKKANMFKKKVGGMKKKYNGPNSNRKQVKLH